MNPFHAISRIAGRGPGGRGHPVLASLLLGASAFAGCEEGKGRHFEAIRFPDGFLWGAATAAHQVEGGNDNNNWWAWEQIEGTIENGDRSGDACDHYNRFEADFALAESMNQNAHRFSIEWSRIEPSRDVYDEVEIEHYHQVIDSMRAHGLKPVVTLSHFTLPLWMDDPLNPGADLGDFRTQEGIDEFVEFAGDMAEEYGDDVDLWIPFNEPMVVALTAYLDLWPPGFGNDLDQAVAFTMGEIFAHAGAYDAIHARDLADADGDGLASKVGVAAHIVVFQPSRPDNALDVAATKRLDHVFNRLFLDATILGYLDVNLDEDTDDDGTTPAEGYHPELAGRMDFLGLNYYRIQKVAGGLPEPLLGAPSDVATLPRNELGWSIYPRGIYESLKLLAEYGMPILITENGIADGDESQRPSFLVDFLTWVDKAIEEQVPVIGYLHWSLYDNFEWAEGFSAKFGLLRLDYETQERIPTVSSDLFAEIAAENGLSSEMQARWRTSAAAE